jgi:hypothetical protein
MLYFWYIAFNFPTNKPVVVSRSNRLNTRRLSRLSTFKILLVQIEIVFLSGKIEVDLQQILHDVPGKTVQRRRLQVIYSSSPHSQINQDKICPVFHKN